MVPRHPEVVFQKIQRPDHGSAPVEFRKQIAAGQVSGIHEDMGIALPYPGGKAGKVVQIAVKIRRGGNAELPCTEEQGSKEEKKK